VTPAGGDTEDPLGLDVEGEAAFPEDQLQVSQLILNTSVGTHPTQVYSSFYAFKKETHSVENKLLNTYVYRTCISCNSGPKMHKTVNFPIIQFEA
jgi:hypothetical protein